MKPHETPHGGTQTVATQSVETQSDETPSTETLSVERFRTMLDEDDQRRDQWRREVHLAAAMAVFTVLQIWAVAIVLSTVTTGGLAGFAIQLIMVGTVLGVVAGWRTVLRQRRR